MKVEMGRHDTQLKLRLNNKILRESLPSETSVQVDHVEQCQRPCQNRRPTDIKQGGRILPESVLQVDCVVSATIHPLKLDSMRNSSNPDSA